MGYFSDRDRALVEALTFDPQAKPSFELLKGCLVWADERANNLTSEGYDRLCDLWIARSLIHRGEPLDSLSIGGDRFKNAWEQALAEDIRWPGFQRLTLSPEDRAYYKQSLKEIEDGEPY
jgi:hypothetical protein